MKIYALKVKSTKETAAIKELAKEGIEAVSPCNRKIVVKKDRRISEELDPLLRGYIFILVNELTPVMMYKIKNTFNVQYILESEIKDSEIRSLFDQEEILIETETVKERVEYISFYGMIRRIIKYKKVKVKKKLSKMISFEIHRKKIGQVIKNISYISFEDYGLIFG